LTDSVRVVHLIQGLEIGGLEMMVVNFLQRLDRSRFSPVVCCFDTLGDLTAQVADRGIPVHLVQRRPGVDLGYIFTLAAFIRRTRPQILHLHNPTAFFYGTLAGKLARVPCIVYTEHGRDFSSGWKTRLANRVLGKLVDRVVAVADYGKRYLAEEEGIAAAKITTIHNGIDAARFAQDYDVDAIRSELGLTPDQPVIGIVARLDPIKNHALLIRAMARLAKQRADAVLLIIGDGPLRQELHSLRDELELAGQIRFLGARSDVPELLSALDLFVLCSKSEGLSLTLAEASAAARPIVATDVGGNSEVVEDGVSGVVIPSDDIEALVAALLKIVSDPELGRKMGRAGRERFERQFTLEGMVAAYQELYSTCL
jgi:sugar transferase (PEP-CTERM/EpsH1 system associated)